MFTAIWFHLNLTDLDGKGPPYWLLLRWTDPFRKRLSMPWDCTSTRSSRESSGRKKSEFRFSFLVVRCIFLGSRIRKGRKGVCVQALNSHLHTCLMPSNLCSGNANQPKSVKSDCMRDLRSSQIHPHLSKSLHVVMTGLLQICFLSSIRNSSTLDSKRPLVFAQSPGLDLKSRKKLCHIYSKSDKLHFKRLTKSEQKE